MSRSSEIKSADAVGADGRSAQRGFATVGGFIKGRAADASQSLFDLKDSAAAIVRSPRPMRRQDQLDAALVEYNEAFAVLSDKGVTLMVERHRLVDLVEHVEDLVNSISHTPKSFDADLRLIEAHRSEFTGVLDFAAEQLERAKTSALGAAAGTAVGTAVVHVAPTAAMWAATTFGTASTGAAISTLSGAAATNAALAWLGGGAVAAGGGGTAAGTALLAMSGPLGWSIAGVSLLASVTLFAAKNQRDRAERQRTLASVTSNTTAARAAAAEISVLVEQTRSLRTRLAESFGDSMRFFGAEFSDLAAPERARLGALVNSTLGAVSLLGRTVETGRSDEQQ